MGDDAAERARRLREDLYRRDPQPDALERYEAALRRVPTPAPISPPVRRTGARRPRGALVAAGVAAVLLGGVAITAVLRPAAAVPGQAEPLIAGGPFAVTDRTALGSLLGPVTADPEAVLQAVQRSELRQLDVWDARQAGVWLQQGTGPVARRIASPSSGSAVARTFSVLVQCADAVRYRWTIRGTTRADRSIHVLETTGTACGRTPTVATFTRPAGAAVRAFDFEIPSHARWGMAFVYAVDPAA